MNLSVLKTVFFKVLIACLIAAATLGVVSVLMGSFNDTFSKAMMTLLLVALHALAGFGFITKNEETGVLNDLPFFTNSFFVFIVFSFIVSIFGVWGLLTPVIIARIYELFSVILFAILHSETLSQMAGRQRITDRIAAVNYAFIAVVATMLIPVILNVNLGPFYYRLLAASAIVDATLSLVLVIMDKLFLQKHPELIKPTYKSVQMVVDGMVTQQQVYVEPKKRMGTIKFIIVVIVVVYFVLPVLFFMLGNL